MSPDFQNYMTLLVFKRENIALHQLSLLLFQYKSHLWNKTRPREGLNTMSSPLTSPYLVWD